MNRGRRIHRQYPQTLETLLPFNGFAGDSGSFERRLEAVALQAAQMQQDVGHAVIGDDEPITARDIEPLHEAGNLKNANALFKTWNLPFGPNPWGPTLRHDVCTRLLFQMAALASNPGRHH
jgi:hypothetical protein